MKILKEYIINGWEKLFIFIWKRLHCILMFKPEGVTFKSPTQTNLNFSPSLVAPLLSMVKCRKFDRKWFLLGQIEVSGSGDPYLAIASLLLWTHHSVFSLKDRALNCKLLHLEWCNVAWYIEESHIRNSTEWRLRLMTSHIISISSPTPSSIN